MKIQFYRRADGKYGWRHLASNGEILANDAGQGYNNREDCTRGAELATAFSDRKIAVEFSEDW